MQSLVPIRATTDFPHIPGSSLSQGCQSTFKHVLSWLRVLPSDQQAGHDHSNGDDLDWRIVSGKNHWQREQRPSCQQRQAKPPRVKPKSEHQEANPCHQIIFAASTPRWHLGEKHMLMGTWCSCFGTMDHSATYSDTLAQSHIASNVQHLNI